ncbi:MAG: helicase C-terminal domain-containing protein [Opitutaceae bacterium]
MQIDLHARKVTLAVGEWADLNFGPTRSEAGRAGLWRARLGQAWHIEMQEQTLRSAPDARFEVPITGDLLRGNWTIGFNGRIDQVIDRPDRTRLREIKTVRTPLPAPGSELRARHQSYFRQLVAYRTLARGSPEFATREIEAELVFIDIDSGITQTVELTTEDEKDFESRIDALLHFVESRRDGLERLAALHFAPAFAHPRPGQESIQQELREAGRASRLVCFEAPTGYGKTGSILEYALHELQAGHVTRVIYLTGKSTGQLQVTRQLDQMLGDPPGARRWQMRSKAEHCINDVYHCFSDCCPYLDGQEERWPDSGLATRLTAIDFPRSLEAVRDIGRDARVCPYEITRAALPLNEIWVGDYNYLFAPANRGMFDAIPGYNPSETLLIVDEAHNLPGRVADSHSVAVDASGAQETLSALEDIGASKGLRHSWREWTLFLSLLKAVESLDPFQEAEIRDLLGAVGREIERTPPDFATLGPRACETLFQSLELVHPSESIPLPRLWWSPANGSLESTCLDAAEAIRETLDPFRQVLFLSATLSPIDDFAERCGLKNSTHEQPFHLVAQTPWRTGAYRVAVDLRVDTRYRQREHHLPTTSATIAALHEHLPGPVAAFFPSYAYARAAERDLARSQPLLRVSMQRARQTLAEQNTFIEEALAFSDVLLLVLGSGYAEGIDLLGGRVGSALVAGPALPEVNAIQEARLGLHRHEPREVGFRRVFQIPGMQKVNQAIGRLVRAPGQRARIVLHCRRFSEASYHDLLDPEYRNGTWLTDDDAFVNWLRE